MRNKVYGKELNKDSFEEKELYWIDRMQAMKQRRDYFEPMWRAALFDFAAHLQGISKTGASAKFDSNAPAPSWNDYADNVFSGGFKATDMRYPLEFAIVMRKLATEAANLPYVAWKILGETDQSPALLFEQVYLQSFYNDENLGLEEIELLLNKNIFGASIAYSRAIAYSNTINTPTERGEDGEWVYEKSENKMIKIKCTNKDIRHVLIDEGCTSPSLSDADDCVVFDYYSGDGVQLKKEFPNVNFEEKGITPIKRSETFQDINDVMGGDQKTVYEVANCYNKVLDEYTILINGRMVRTSPIPMLPNRGEKELPISIIVDHKIPNCPYGYGEPAIIRVFRQIKNKNRNLIYDVTRKTAKPTLVVDPNSSFSEEDYFWGQDILRLDPNAMKPVPINANLDWALDLDARTDQDIVIATGVNHLDNASSGADETATKSVLRKESGLALVNFGLTYNTMCGFKHMHEVNANLLITNLKSPNFQPHSYDEKTDTRTINTENIQIFNAKTPKTQAKGKFVAESRSGVSAFTYKWEDVKHYFVPVLKVGNIAVSEQLEKNLKLEGLQSMAQIAPQSYNQEAAANIIRDLFGFPEELVITKEVVQQDTATTPNQEVADAIRKYGAPLSEEQNISLTVQNAQKAQGVPAAPEGSAPMGESGAPTGPAPAPGV